MTIFRYAYNFNFVFGGIHFFKFCLQGYCDVFLKCRAVDADGPLVRLMNLLLNKETLLNVAGWVTEYWWAVVLMGIGFIIFMGLFIKCCAVHTPSSNPKKPPARRFSETLRRPMNTLRRMRHPHAGTHHAGATGGGHHGHHPEGGGRPGRSGRSTANHGPRRGFGDGRGQHHSAPKGNNTNHIHYFRPCFKFVFNRLKPSTHSRKRRTCLIQI